MASPKPLYAILGIGASGQGAARLALQIGATPVIYDSGTGSKVETLAATLRTEGIAVVIGDGWKAKAKQKHDLCIISPGIDPWSDMPLAFAESGALILGELEFAYQQLGRVTPSAPIVAITGTNGKTTTTELVVAFLLAGGKKTQPSGNHGRPLADIIAAKEAIDIHTVEVSSFQLETVQRFRPQVALWMNFAEDHLDRHPTMDDYFQAKARIFGNQLAEDLAVLKLEDRRPEKLTAKSVTFSAFSSEADISYDGRWICRGETQLIDFQQSRLRGRHNVENVMAAAMAAEACGVSWEAMQTALLTFTPPRHRCEFVAEIDGREFVNDSKSTNIHSVESCLRALPGPLVLIAGGKDKGLNYEPLTPLIASATSAVVVIGEIAPTLVNLWKDATRVIQATSMEDAVHKAYHAAVPGQTILLSPGTSSFDMFTGYDHRGCVFEEAIRQMKKSL